MLPAFMSDATAEPSRRSRYILALVVMAVSLGLDLWSKQWAWDTLRTGKRVELVKNWAYFEWGFNTGSAFSLLHDVSWSRVLFIVVSFGALAYMAKLAKDLPTQVTPGFWAVGLIAGGCLGNLHDRMFRVMELRGEMRHGVVDFIKVFYWPHKPWPTFNVADIALVVGIGLLLLFMGKAEALMNPDPEAGEAAKAAA